MSQSADLRDLRQLRIQAKELVRAVRAAKPDALARAGPYLRSSTEVMVAAAQLVVARENGFDSWPRLRTELEPANAPAGKSPTTLLFEALESGDDEGRRSRADPIDPGSRRGLGSGKRHFWTTPMFVAASLGRLAPVRALVDAGAEIYAVNQGGYPPVFEAIHAGHREVAEFLLEASAKGDRGGLPPTYGCGIDIVLAARLGLLDRIQMHVERDPLAVFRRGCIGESVLHWPAHNQHVEVVRYLLDNGALIDADEIGLYGGKPLHWAAEHAPSCVALLLERGADPNSRNLRKGEFEGFTPLHMMARQREQELECARLLIEAGADTALTDARGHTALDVATANGREKVVKFLG